MVKVKTLRASVSHDGKVTEAGTILELEYDAASDMVDKGLAVPILEKPKQTRAKKVGAERVQDEENS